MTSIPWPVLAVGAAAIGTLLLTAPAAEAMTFQEGCGATHGQYSVDTKGLKEFCQWTDKNGTTWKQWNPLQVIAPLPGQGRAAS